MDSRFGIYPSRVWIALGLIVLFAGISSARWARNAAAVVLSAPRVDPVTASEARYRELRRVLPPHAVVGYLSDPEPPNLPRPESRRYYQRFILTQYALSPVIVLRNTEPDLVVGDFDVPAHADSATAIQLTLLHDFGDGLMLFRRERE